jgi:hypothetical protein
MPDNGGKPMAAHMDEVFKVVDGQAIVEQYIPYDEPEICVDGDSYYNEEFKDCADGWYWQHRRIRPSRATWAWVASQKPRSLRKVRGSGAGGINHPVTFLDTIGNGYRGVG